MDILRKYGLFGCRAAWMVWFLCTLTELQGEEGMWIPMLIERYQIATMHEAGLRLDAEDIYSINQDCLKDAVVLFNGGCTAGIISADGLLLTNHHCGKSAILSHSTLDNNYLDNGFWAMTREEELPNPAMSVTFLRYMREVTAEVNDGILPGMEPGARQRRQDLNMGRIIRDATSGSDLDAEVVPFYDGNEYYLFVYEVFRDIRLVGAPPLSIGDFGGERDNWMWPRHAGDFALFRIYADGSNRPAGYHPFNRPYEPRNFLEISTAGIRDGDFTMILGFPGSTSAYLHSEGIRQLMEWSLPLKVELRGARMAIMERYMEGSDTLRLQYTSRYYGISNYMKKWQGVLSGFRQLGVLERKLQKEQLFRQWVAGDDERLVKYEHLLEQISRLYAELRPYSLAADLMEEAVLPVEAFGQVNTMLGMMITGTDPDLVLDQAGRFFADYHLPMDREVFASMMQACYRHMPGDFLPSFLKRAERRFDGDFHRFAEATFRRSVFSDPSRVIRLCELYRDRPRQAIEQLLQDPLANCYDQFLDKFMARVEPRHNLLQEELSDAYRDYMKGLMEMTGEGRLYPDANLTMRVTYGQVSGYTPLDGTWYGSSTTLSGVLEKGAGNDLEEYRIPGRLVQLFEAKDYGPYGVDGTMPVCFIASNHTSGGNSGSPVLDGEGRLIGLNFDRNWEGTVSDYNYDRELCRNISVDIRYILFIVDKFAGAGHLLEEMVINR